MSGRKDGGPAMPPCRTCQAEVDDIARKTGDEIKLPPADYVAMAGPIPWPACNRHMEMALLAGWRPIYDADSDEARDAMLRARESSHE